MSGAVIWLLRQRRKAPTPQPRVTQDLVEDSGHSTYDLRRQQSVSASQAGTAFQSLGTPNDHPLYEAQQR